MGSFAGERVERVRGIIVPVALNEALTKLRTGVRVLLPIIAWDESEPEPDLAAVPPGDYADALHDPDGARRSPQFKPVTGGEDGGRIGAPGAAPLSTRSHDGAM